MVDVHLEDNFIITTYKDWNALDFGIGCQTAYNMLENSDQPLYLIAQTLDNPINLNLEDMVSTYRSEIERLHNHPKILKPTTLILTPRITSIAKALLRTAWLKKYHFTFVHNISEAKILLNTISANR